MGDLVKVEKRCYRAIRSKYPAIDVFESVSTPDEFELLFELEGQTSNRLRQECGNVNLVPIDDMVLGRNGAGYIMAAFTYPNPNGSRFSDGSYGIFYCAFDAKTAIKETIFHIEKHLQDTPDIGETEVDMRCLVASINSSFFDATKVENYNDIHDPNDYRHSVALGISRKKLACNGILYDSVRDPGGTCLAILRPPAIEKVIQEKHLAYVFDGQKITHWYTKSGATQTGKA